MTLNPLITLSELDQALRKKYSSIPEVEKNFAQKLESIGKSILNTSLNEVEFSLGRNFMPGITWKEAICLKPCSKMLIDTSPIIKVTLKKLPAGCAIVLHRKDNCMFLLTGNSIRTVHVNENGKVTSQSRLGSFSFCELSSAFVDVLTSSTGVYMSDSVFFSWPPEPLMLRMFFLRKLSLLVNNTSHRKFIINFCNLKDALKSDRILIENESLVREYKSFLLENKTVIFKLGNNSAQFPKRFENLRRFKSGEGIVLNHLPAETEGYFAEDEVVYVVKFQEGLTLRNAQKTLHVPAGKKLVQSRVENPFKVVGSEVLVSVYVKGDHNMTAYDVVLFNLSKDKLSDLNLRVEDPYFENVKHKIWSANLPEGWRPLMKSLPFQKNIPVFDFFNPSDSVIKYETSAANTTPLQEHIPNEVEDRSEITREPTFFNSNDVDVDYDYIQEELVAHPPSPVRVCQTRSECTFEEDNLPEQVSKKRKRKKSDDVKTEAPVDELENTLQTSGEDFTRENSKDNLEQIKEDLIGESADKVKKSKKCKKRETLEEDAEVIDGVPCENVNVKKSKKKKHDFENLDPDVETVQVETDVPKTKSCKKEKFKSDEQLEKHSDVEELKKKKKKRKHEKTEVEDDEQEDLSETVVFNFRGQQVEVLRNVILKYPECLLARKM